jgi:drug/metabolite transporter (DMT)-like permease
MTPDRRAATLQLFRAPLLASLFALVWAVMERIGAGIRASPYQVVWTRYGTQLALVLLIFGGRHRGRLVKTAKPGLQVAASLHMLGMPLFFIAAMKRMDAGNAMAIFWVSPLIAAAATVLLTREPVRLPQWAGIVAASAGAVLLSNPHGGIFRLADVFPLGMALCFAGYQVDLRAMAREHILAKLFHTALWVFLCLSLAIPLFWQTPSRAGLVEMAFVGLIGCFGLFVLDRALEIASAAAIAPAICMQPVWAELLSFRRPGWHSVIGAALVIAGGAVSLGLQALSNWRHSAAAPGAGA